MTEIDKINEELRNYKLFKIQRINTKEQQFNELKTDLIKIRKNEVLTYIIGTLNVILIAYLIYNIIKSHISPEFYQINKDIILLNLILVLFLSIYFTFKQFTITSALKKHIKSSEDAVNYFSNESEKLKSSYESYVNNYLEEVKKKK